MLARPAPRRTRGGVAFLPVRLRGRSGRTWLAALLLAVAAGLIAARLVAAADGTVARWGTTRIVPVTLREVPAGSPLTSADVAEQARPVGMIPDAAVAEAPVGRVAAVDLAAGEVVLTSRLAPAGVQGPAALLPPGSVGVAVPDAGGLPLAVGDVVDVLATFDPEATGDRDPTVVVARAARVVATGAEGTGAVTVAVAEADATRVAYAVAAGLVVLTLRSTP